MSAAGVGDRLEAQGALIQTMVLVSAAEGVITDAELDTIGRLVRTLPVFIGYEASDVIAASRECAALLAEPDGSEKVAARIALALSPGLRETAYCLACEVAAVDGALGRGEKDVLRWLRGRLQIDSLVAAAIERSANARYRRL